MEARLYVAPHGTALSNMVFMPPNATVLEVRPNAFPNDCFRILAFACGLHYHLSLGEGSKHTTLLPHMEDLRKNLVHIRQRFDDEDGGQRNDR